MNTAGARFDMYYVSVLPLPVGTGWPRPPLSKNVLILTMKLWKMKKF
jgi:hypothetical protein